MNKLILGVDGGSTKSHLAVFDETEKCLAALTYGPLNHECMDGSYDELRTELIDAVKDVLDGVTSDNPDMPKVSAGDISYAVFGLSGVDSKEQEVLISDIVRDIGFRDFSVCNDALLGIPAGCPNGIGICAINGTGFKLAAIDKSGIICEVGGLGEYTDDKGGGTWYGQRACAEVYNALFRLGKPTKMRDMLFNLLDISNKSEIMAEFTRILYGVSPFYNSVQLNSIVFTAAALGDSVALGILQESAAAYGGAIARLAMDLDFPCNEPVCVALTGSMFTRQKTTLLQDMTTQEVARILGDREVSYYILKAPPVAGAVITAAQKAGLSFDCDNVKSILSEEIT